MGKTIIITDSGCDIPKDMLKDNIKVIPYTICVGKNEFIEENTISKKVFSQKMKMGFRPLGIGLRRQNILDILNDLDEEYDDIVFIVSSGMLYPDNEVVIIDTILEFFANHKQTRIAIIDSNTTSMALGFLVLDAAMMAEMGCSFDEIVGYVNDNKSRYRMELVANDVTALNEKRVISSRKAKLVGSHEKNYLISMSKFGMLRPIMGRTSDIEIKKIMIDRLIDNYSEYYAIVSSILNHEGSYFADYISRSIDLNPVNSRFDCSNTTFVGTDTICLCYKKKK